MCTEIGLVEANLIMSIRNEIRGQESKRVQREGKEMKSTERNEDSSSRKTFIPTWLLLIIVRTTLWSVGAWLAV